MYRFFQIGLFTFVIAMATFPVAAWSATQMDDLENALMCNCKDDCGKVLINCTCDHSKKMRKDLKGHLDSGLTVKQVVKVYVDEFGETILSAPTKSGFNLSAWVTPFVALVIGGVGVRQIMRKWIKRPGNNSDEGTPSASGENKGEAPSSGFSSRVKRELEKLED